MLADAARCRLDAASMSSCCVPYPPKPRISHPRISHAPAPPHRPAGRIPALYQPLATTLRPLRPRAEDSPPLHRPNPCCRTGRPQPTAGRRDRSKAEVPWQLKVPAADMRTAWRRRGAALLRSTGRFQAASETFSPRCAARAACAAAIEAAFASGPNASLSATTKL